MRINYENQTMAKLYRKSMAILDLADYRILSNLLFYGQNVRRRERGNYWRYRFFTDECATHRYAQPLLETEKTKQS